MYLRRVEKEDLQRVLEIRNKVLLENVEEPKNGFLITKYSKEDYEDFLNETEDFYVGIKDGKIVSFVLCGYEYVSDNIIDSKQYINEEKYFYVKQICVDLDSEHKGIGTETYNQLFKKVKREYIFLSIVIKPYNENSVNFHTKNGFKKVREFEKGEYKLSLWNKKLFINH